MLQKQEQRLVNEKIVFLESIPPLNFLSRSQLKKFARNLKQIVIHRTKFLYKQEDSPDFVYIVREGEFALTFKFKDKY
jgi:CRP-like cAMP-binding protein